MHCLLNTDYMCFNGLPRGLSNPSIISISDLLRSSSEHEAAHSPDDTSCPRVAEQGCFCKSAFLIRVPAEPTRTLERKSFKISSWVGRPTIGIVWCQRHRFLRWMLELHSAYTAGAPHVGGEASRIFAKIFPMRWMLRPSGSNNCTNVTVEWRASEPASVNAFLVPLANKWFSAAGSNTKWPAEIHKTSFWRGTHWRSMTSFSCVSLSLAVSHTLRSASRPHRRRASCLPCSP